MLWFPKPLEGVRRAKVQRLKILSPLPYCVASRTTAAANVSGSTGLGMCI